MSNGPVRIPDVVDRVVGAVPDTVHRLSVRMSASTPMVIADGVRLEQVLGNLVDNARKYSPVGSEIVISSAVTERGVELSVADEGAGIDPEFMPHLFKPFTQADAGDTRRDHGVGLGLSISHGLVEAMGGTIEVHSEVGAGTRFTVVLPRVVPIPASPVDTVTRITRAG